MKKRGIVKDGPVFTDKGAELFEGRACVKCGNTLRYKKGRKCISCRLGVEAKKMREKINSEKYRYEYQEAEEKAPLKMVVMFYKAMDKARCLRMR